MTRPIVPHSFAQPIATNAFYGSFSLSTRVNYLAIPIILLVVGGVFYYVATRFFGGRNDKNGEAFDKTGAGTEKNPVKESRPGNNAESPGQISAEQSVHQRQKVEKPALSATASIAGTGVKENQVEQSHQLGGDIVSSSGQILTAQPPVTQEQKVKEPTSSTTTPISTASTQKPKLELKKPLNGSAVPDTTSLYEGLMQKIITKKSEYDEACIKYAVGVLESLSQHASDGLEQLSEFSRAHKLSPQEVGELLLDGERCYVLLILDNLSKAYHTIRQNARVEGIKLMAYNGKRAFDSNISPPSKIIQYKDLMDENGKIPPEKLLKALEGNQVVKFEDPYFQSTAPSIIHRKHTQRFYNGTDSCQKLRDAYNAPLEKLQSLLPPDHELLVSPKYRQDLDRASYIGPDQKKVVMHQ